MSDFGIGFNFGETCSGGYAPNYYGGNCEVTDSSAAALSAAMNEPRQASVDGVNATSHSLPDLIAAIKFQAARKAACSPSRGIRFTKLVQGGSVT